MSKITILGAGNGGMAMAYALGRKGHDVCIYDSPKFPAQIEAVKKQGGIEAVAEMDGAPMLDPCFAKITLATTDIKEAMEFADILMIICPSFAQEIMFDSMLPYLRNNMIIFIVPGNYGGLILNKQLHYSEKRNLNITFIDTISLPWATRLAHPGAVALMGVKEFMPMSVFPKVNKTTELETTINEVFPIQPEFLPNPIVAAFENINFGAHPVLSILNMGICENFNGQFSFYGDCCSTAVAKVEDSLDKERLAVGESLHMKLRTELEANNVLYNLHAKSMYDFNKGSDTHSKIKNAPTSSKARYITEDVPYLFVPFCELAELCGVDVPIAKSLVTLASCYNDEDYMKTGRTLAKMGFEHWSKQEILEFMER